MGTKGLRLQSEASLWHLSGLPRPVMRVGRKPWQPGNDGTTKVVDPVDMEVRLVCWVADGRRAGRGRGTRNGRKKKKSFGLSLAPSASPPPYEKRGGQESRFQLESD